MVGVSLKLASFVMMSMEPLWTAASFVVHAPISMPITVGVIEFIFYNYNFLRGWLYIVYCVLGCARIIQNTLEKNIEVSKGCFLGEKLQLCFGRFLGQKKAFSNSVSLLFYFFYLFYNKKGLSYF